MVIHKTLQGPAPDAPWHRRPYYIQVWPPPLFVGFLDTRHLLYELRRAAKLLKEMK